MTKYNIQPAYMKKIKHNTYKRIEFNVKLDLVKRNFNVDKENQIGTTDITYLILKAKERIYQQY